MNVSVIIPCYNAEPYVAQTIGSVLEQTRPADQIIVVDDGSTDRSLEAVRPFGDRVLLLTGRNGGASPTRNKGLGHATGDALMFLDSDDVLGPTALEALVDSLRQRPGAVAACPWFRLEQEDGLWVKKPASCAPRRAGQDPLAGWLTGWYHPPCSVLWSREAFQTVGRWDERGGPNDDGHVMMQALARGVPLVLTEEGESFYRRLLPTDAPSVSSARLTAEGLSARLWVMEQVALTLRQRGRLHEYRVPLDEALERITRESDKEHHPEVAAEAVAVARRYAGYPWVRTVRRVRRRATGIISSVRRRASLQKETRPAPKRSPQPSEVVEYGLVEGESHSW
jgi:hypothetical protein